MGSVLSYCAVSQISLQYSICAIYETIIIIHLP